MAKGSTQKGMRMIGPTLGHQVKQLEVKTQRAGARSNNPCPFSLILAIQAFKVSLPQVL
ncbi:hypothetical protein BKA82DRAFT_21206 [Pisolithus tinctorius]|nr:hypothetical protein BKA82DRAFT_21206 [Pisolithus tinctorius]